MLLGFALYGAGGVAADQMFGRNRLIQWVGTTGADGLTSTTRDANEVFGGRGNDSLFVGSGSDEAHGGVGNDMLVGGADNDVLVPGRGLDFVQGDAGNDKVIISGTCELLAGETISGGSGTDTLYTPVSLAALATLGVTVTSIESVVINHADLQLATCATLGALGPVFP